MPEVLAVHRATARLFRHVLAATVWVGGQLTLAELVPGLRAVSPDAPRNVAPRFNQIAWPALAVLVLTGIWKITAVHPHLARHLRRHPYGQNRRGRPVWVERLGAGHEPLANPAGHLGRANRYRLARALFLGVLLHG